MQLEKFMALAAAAACGPICFPESKKKKGKEPKEKSKTVKVYLTFTWAIFYFYDSLGFYFLLYTRE